MVGEEEEKEGKRRSKDQELHIEGEKMMEKLKDLGLGIIMEDF